MPGSNNVCDFEATWKRLENWSPDELGATFPFSVRLARENGWSLRYAQRAVAEYKRFMTLAAAGETRVCPSEDVDEVWHLHLCYTRSYWDELCGQILGKPIHHEPTRGGTDQLEHHRAMYAATLETYRDVFQREPPADIWPTVDERFGAPGRFQRVDRTRHWLLPKPPWRTIVQSLGTRARQQLPAVTLAALPLSLATLNPLEMRGQQFLVFYSALLVVSILLGCALRWLLRATDDRRPLPELDAMQVAVLNGGERFASQVALADLVAADYINIETDATRTLVVNKALPDGKPLIERAIYEAVSDSSLATPSLAAEAAAPETARMAGELEELGLLETADSAAAARWLPTVLMGLVLVLGVAKILVGISRGKPIMFLVLLCTVAWIALSAFRKKLLRTKKGERVLKEIRDSNPELNDATDLLTMSDAQMLLGLGLFGLAPLALADGRLGELNRWLGPAADPNSRGWGSFTSSGSSGDSGCGGDGGGCGGGCGGCGD